MKKDYPNEHRRSSSRRHHHHHHHRHSEPDDASDDTSCVDLYADVEGRAAPQKPRRADPVDDDDVTKKKKQPPSPSSPKKPPQGNQRFRQVHQEKMSEDSSRHSRSTVRSGDVQCRKPSRDSTDDEDQQRRRRRPSPPQRPKHKSCSSGLDLGSDNRRTSEMRRSGSTPRHQSYSPPPPPSRGRDTERNRQERQIRKTRSVSRQARRHRRSTSRNRRSNDEDDPELPKQRKRQEAKNSTTDRKKRPSSLRDVEIVLVANPPRGLSSSTTLDGSHDPPGHRRNNSKKELGEEVRGRSPLRNMQSRSEEICVSPRPEKHKSTRVHKRSEKHPMTPKRDRMFYPPGYSGGGTSGTNHPNKDDNLLVEFPPGGLDAVDAASSPRRTKTKKYKSKVSSKYLSALFTAPRVHR